MRLALLLLVACSSEPSLLDHKLAPPNKPVPQVQPVTVTADKVRTIEGITEYRLPNGMQFLLFPDETQSNVTVNVTYLVGSRHEGYGETGMAHLLEHMMFKGTKTDRDIWKTLEALGASNNASTDYDRTNYYETLPATGDNLDRVLALEADRMVNSTFLEADLASEFSVVRNEFESGENDPSGVLYERIRSTAYLWHNYGKSVIGSRADIEKVPASALRVFYAKYYQPDNAVLVVSGKFDAAKTIATIERTFGAIPKPTRIIPPTYTIEPQQDGEREVTLRRTGDLAVVGVAYHAVAATSPDYAAVDAAVDMLSREPSGILYTKLVATKLASSLSGDAAANHDPQLVEFFAETRDAATLPQIEKILDDEIEHFAAPEDGGRTRSDRIDQKALDRWRTSTLKEIELAMTNSSRLALELSENIALGDWRMLFAYRDAVEKVTLADVQRVAKQYFVASNRTTGRFFPTKEAIVRAPLTETPDVAAIVKDVKGRADLEPGETFVATPDSIEGRVQRKDLANGIKAALFPKKTRGGKVMFSLTFHFGTETSLQNTDAVTALVGPMLTRGTTKHGYQELSDLEDQMKAHVSVAVGTGSVVVSIDTLRDKLPGAIDLAAEMVLSPSFPANEFEVVKQEELASLESTLSDPESISSEVMAQLADPWPKGDPRATPSTRDQIEAVKKVALADVAAFYQAHLGGGHAELVVVGDFDPTAITAQVEKLFGTWKAVDPYTRLGEKAFGVEPQQKSIDTPDKENAQLLVQHDVAMQDDDPDYPAWIVLGEVFGGDSGSRIWQRLREKGGMSYGAWGYTSASSFDKAGEIGAGGGIL